MNHPIASGILLGLAVACTILFSLGLMIMRDAFQRLHFTTPVVAFGAGFIAIAVWIEESDPQAIIKAALILVILTVMNSVLCHATGKAVRIRQAKHWAPRISEGIPLVGTDGPAGSEEEGEEHRS